VHLSLSHTRDHALFALGNSGPLGIDLEGDRTIQLGTARLALMIAAAEALAGSRADDDRPDTAAGSVAAWTVLEAFAKARGSGIGALLTELGITAAGARSSSPEEVAARAAGLVATTCFHVHRLQLPKGWHGAVAVPGGAAVPDLVPRMMRAEHCAHPL
jgi:phosphopantetheinyl transferase